MSPSELDIMGPAALSDPYRYFARSRETEPVVWDQRHKTWLILDHKNCLAALRDPRFSSDRVNPFIARKLSGPDVSPLVRRAFEVLAGWMVFKDGADHSRLRTVLARAFTPKAVQAMKERVNTLSDELLAKISRENPFDLIRDFSIQLPSIVIAEMLGVPVADRNKFNRWSEDVAPVVSASLEDRGKYERVASGMDALVNYFAVLLRRYEAEPQDNLITALLRASDNASALNEEEILATCTLILFGGHETTANLIANSMLALLRHPDQIELLHSGRVDMAKMIEEFLRYDGPGKAVVRVIREDMEFAGCNMQAGQRVFIVLATANHDPAAFDDPDVLRLDRDPKHIAFGHGSHFCMGAALARLEGSIAIPKVMEAFPRLRLTDDPLNWQPVFLTRGLKELRVRAS